MTPAALRAFVVLAAAVGGCGRPADDGLVPVGGRATVGGRPLTSGTVSFRPDADRGNASLHHPTGPVAADGAFVLYTAGRPGAPPGWYKVLVFADANERRGGPVHPLPPKWLTHPRYTREATTDLRVEVVAAAPPGAYDFALTE